MTTAELKDAAIFVMAYSFLQMDSTEELGLFINKKASKFIDELIEAMTPIVGYYHAFKSRIETQIFDIDPVWVNFSIYDLFYLKSAERERLLEAYKKLKDEQ